MIRNFKDLIEAETTQRHSKMNELLKKLDAREEGEALDEINTEAELEELEEEQKS